MTGMIPCPLTTFIMSYALARGLVAAGLAVAAAMALGMIATIGGIALAAAFARDRFMGCSPDRELALSRGKGVGGGRLSAGAGVRPLDDAQVSPGLRLA